MSDGIINSVSGYETSRDYEALFEFAKKQSVVCIVDYKGFGDVLRDVCQTIYSGGEKYESMQISVRGCTYVHAFTRDDKSKTLKEEFVEDCKKLNVEFIPPHIPF